MQLLAISGSLRVNSSNTFLVGSNNITLAIAGRGLDTQGIIADPELSTSLKDAIAALAQTILAVKEDLF